MKPASTSTTSPAASKRPFPAPPSRPSTPASAASPSAAPWSAWATTSTPLGPDLVIILFGANDAGSDHPVERVRHELATIIDHLILETQADVLVLSPTVGAYKIDLLDQYAAMYKDLAAEKGVAFFDLRAAQKALPQDEQDRLLHDDKTHMVEYGHEKTGELLLSYVLSTLKPSPAAP